METGEQTEIKALPETRHLDREHHLLYTDNFPGCVKPVVLVTGSPEGPNQLAGKRNLLDEYFQLKRQGFGCAQVYLGTGFDSRVIGENIAYALDLAGKPSQLAIYSAGALGLPDLSLENIEYLTLISPFLGREMIVNPLFRFALRFLPDTKTFVPRITQTLNTLSKRGKVSVFLGENDDYLDYQKTLKVIQENFPRVKMIAEPRQHAITAKQLISFLPVTPDAVPFN